MPPLPQESNQVPQEPQTFTEAIASYQGQPQSFDEAIASYQQGPSVIEEYEKNFQQQLSYLDNLLYGARQRKQEVAPDTPERKPDRGLFMEAMAGIGSGALGTFGSGLSGIERIAERIGIDPSGEDAGWFRQAGDALKKGAQQIQASPDREVYFKLFNAFGSILGFAAPAIVAAPFSGIAALGISGSLAAGTGADEAYERAKKAKATDEQIDQAVGLGTAVGLTEILAPIRILNKLAKVFPDWDFAKKFINKEGLQTSSTEELIKKTTKDAQGKRLAKILGVNDTGIKEWSKRVAITAGLEGSQEFGAAVAQNAIERYLYNPEVDLLNADAIEEGLYGGSAGAMLDGIISTFSLRKARGYRKKMNEFLESDNFKAINSEAESAAVDYQAAEDRIKELEEGPRSYNTAQKLGQAIGKRDRAAERIKRSNAVMEKALNDQVYTSNEIVDYLTSQQTTDENGNEVPLYNKEYLEELQKSDKKNGTSYLKDAYINHVQNRRTKHETDAEEKLVSTINPDTRTEYTVEEIETIKSQKGKEALSVEVAARVDDAKRYTYEAQQGKIRLRNEYGMSASLADAIYNNFYYNRNNDSIQYINTVNEILTKDPTQSATIKDIMEADTSLGVKKSRLTRLRNAQIKEEQRIKEEADKVESEKLKAKVPPIIETKTEDVTETEVLESGIAEVAPGRTRTAIGDVDSKGRVSVPTKQAEVQTGAKAGTDTAPTRKTSGSKEVRQKIWRKFDKPLINGVPTDRDKVSEVLKEYNERTGELALMQEGEYVEVKQEEEGKPVTEDINVKGKPIFTDDVSKEEIIKDENDRESIENQIQTDEISVIAKPDIDPTVDKEGEGDVVPDNVEIIEEGPDAGDLNDNYMLVLQVLEDTQMPLDLIDTDVFTSEDIQQAINDHGSGWVGAIRDKIGSLDVSQDMKKSMQSYGSAIIQDFKNLNITNKDLDLLKGAMPFFDLKDINFDMNEEVNQDPETTLDGQVGENRFKEMARAVAQMIGVSGSPKNVVEATQNGNRITYKFANSETDNVTVVFKPFTEKDQKDSSGYFDSTVNTININTNNLNTWSSALGTTAHEGFHAAKKLLLFKEQIQNVFNKVLTPQLAKSNGWDASKYNQLVNNKFPTPDKKDFETEEEFNTALNQQRADQREFIIEEAQAYLFGKWYRGDYVEGLSPAPRNLMDIIKRFINQFANFAKSLINRENVKAEKKEDMAELVVKQFEDFASGRLAEAVGRRNIPDGANLAANLNPVNTESILKSSVNKLMSGTTLSRGTEGSWGLLKDISNFTRLFAHNSDISRRSPLYNAFYNQIQKRIRFRNMFKIPAAQLLEKVGVFEGIYQLNKEQRNKTGQLAVFADEGGTAPIFKNLNTENASVSITLSQANLQDLINRYEGKSVGKVDLLDPNLRFYRDTGINPAEIQKAQVPVEGTESDVTNIYTMENNDIQIVHAFNGSYSAVQQSGNNQFAGLVHAFLTQPALADTVIKIRTVDELGEPRSYDDIMKDVLDLKAKLKEEGLIDGDGLLKEAAYKAYEKRAELEKIPAEDRLLGGLKYEYAKDPRSLKIGAKEVWNIINTITGEKRKGYFPHFRMGDAVVGVWRVDGDVKTLVRMESVNNNRFTKLSGIPVIGDKIKKNIRDKQEELRQELTEEYGVQDFDVRSFDLTLDDQTATADEKKVLRQAIGKVQELEGIFTGEKREGKSPEYKSASERVDAVRRFSDMIEKELLETRVESLTRERKNIPGYLNKTNNDGNYFLKALQRYIDETANTASSLFTDADTINSIETIGKDVKGGKSSNLYKAAQRTFDYINDPNNESTALRAYAFHSFLGYNLSSAVVNLTQTVQATYPILSAITGVRRGSVHVPRALKDTIKLYRHMMKEMANSPRMAQYGFTFFTSEFVTNEKGETTGTKMVLDRSRKPDWMKDDEFEMIAQLFKEGAIQPIQNMDLGATEYIGKINNKAIRPVVEASGYAFGTIENMNRVTAALAFYRTAKEDAANMNKNKWNAFAKGTRFGEPVTNQDGVSVESDTEAGINQFATRMARMGVEKSQFFMGKENRPRVFQGPIMSAMTQFQSFVWQMVGMYATSFKQGLLGKELDVSLSPDEAALARSIARKQLGLMTLTMLGFSGAMGLPFAENLKQLIKFLSENFGDEVAYDVEIAIRETIGPVLGADATDMVLRGPLRQLGISMDRRVGYGEAIPARAFVSGDPVDFMGPAASRIWDQVAGLMNAYRRGGSGVDYGLGIAQATLPVALGNLIRATHQESTRGIQTQRGQHILPPGYLTMGEKAMYALGFTPTEVAQAREARGVRNYYDYRARNGKEKFTNMLTDNGVQMIKAQMEGDWDLFQEKSARNINLWNQVWKHDSEQTREDTKYNIRSSTVNKRIMRALYPEMGLPKTSVGKLSAYQSRDAFPTIEPR